MLRHSVQNASIGSRIAIGFLRSIATNLNIVESLVSLQAKNATLYQAIFLLTYVRLRANLNYLHSF